MALINVYSRSPISHKFTVLENDFEKEYVIEGTNQHGVIMFDRKTPRITEIDEDVFKKIKEKYKDHISLFGGKNKEGAKSEALIYVSKSKEDAQKLMEDAKPVITDIEMATKTQGVKDLTPKIKLG